MRKASAQDLLAVTQLAAECASFDATPTLADIKVMQASNPEYFFVADDDGGRVVGFVAGQEKKGIPQEVLEAWSASKVGYVELMAVHPAYRRTGVGRALMNAILEEFRKNHIDVVNLDVPVEQGAAVGLYQSIGFSVRAYFMRKRLAER